MDRMALPVGSDSEPELDDDAGAAPAPAAPSQQLEQPPADDGATPAPSLLMVAVDGARLSHIAFGMALMLRKAGEKLLVYHVFDPRKKDRLPGYYGPDYLETQFSGMLATAGVPVSEGSVVCEQRVDDEPVSRMILAKASAEGARVLVLGAFGRKGPSVWQIGSNTDWSVRRARDVSVVTAKVDSAIDNPQVFCVGHDGSSRSDAALAFALERARPGDRLFAVHIRNEWRESRGFNPLDLQRAFGEAVEASGAQLSSWEIVFLEKDYQQTVSQQLVRAAESEDICATYLVVGRDGVGAIELAEKTGFGTVAEYVARKSRTTSVIVH